jgi:hypothetical protein
VNRASRSVTLIAPDDLPCMQVLATAPMLPPSPRQVDPSRDAQAGGRLAQRHERAPRENGGRPRLPWQHARRAEGDLPYGGCAVGQLALLSGSGGRQRGELEIVLRRSLRRCMQVLTTALSLPHR